MGLVLWQGSQEAERQWAVEAPETPPAATVPASLSSRLLFFGDMYWGRDVNRRAQASELKEKFPFSGLHEFDREAYDAWIANLECPTVPGVNQPYAAEVNSLIFNCPVAYLPEAAQWFDAVSLANNHTANQNGQTGLDATRQQLDKHGIQYFGHYNPEILDDVCEVISLPVRVTMSDGGSRQAELPVALCGYHGLDAVPSADSLAVMRRYAAVMPVFAFPHMGAEYVATADAHRARVYREMIDSGADAVLGGHPHWVQPVEAYKGKLIAYSLGNFMFDQIGAETNRGAAIDLTLKVEAGAVNGEQLNGWLELGEACGKFRDDCLDRIKERGLEKLPLKFNYNTPIAVDVSDRVTSRGDAALQADTLERLDWSAAADEL